MKRLWLILRHPGQFFQIMKEERGYGGPFKYYLFLLLIQFLVVNSIMVYAVTSLSSAMASSPIDMSMFYSMLLSNVFYTNFFLLLSILLIFVLAGIYHLFAKILGAKGGYNSTFKALVYAGTPSVPVMVIALPSLLIDATGFLIMGLSLLAFLWVTFLFVKGLSVFHGISKIRALLVWVIPVILLLVVTVLLAGLAWVFLSQYVNNVVSTQAQIVDAYCSVGTTSNVVLMNIGTDTISLGSCSEGSVNGASAECGDLSVTKTSGGTMNGGFSSTSMDPGDTTTFSDACTTEGAPATCAYRFLAGSGMSAPITATLTCSG